jgi:hypothetical protein
MKLTQLRGTSEASLFCAGVGSTDTISVIRRGANCFARNQNDIAIQKSSEEFPERRDALFVFSQRKTKGGETMRKISCVLAALATIAVAAPTVASAEGFGFRIGSDRDYYRDRDDYRGPRAEFYEHDRGLHRGWYNHDGDRTVIIKRHRHWDD